MTGKRVSFDINTLKAITLAASISQARPEFTELCAVAAAGLEHMRASDQVQVIASLQSLDKYVKLHEKGSNHD